MAFRSNVAIPLSTIDWRLKKGSAIPIEERAGSEVLGAWASMLRGRRTYVARGEPDERCFATPPST